MPIPLTGTAAFRAEVPWNEVIWTPAFLRALADEATDALQVLFALEHAWLAARAAVADRRRHSRASVAIDIIAASSLISATTLSQRLGMALKNALALLEDLARGGLVVEVTSHSSRRLLGFPELAPIRDGVRPPRRSISWLRSGRPALIPSGEAENAAQDLPPVGPIQRRTADYTDLENAMPAADLAIRRANDWLKAENWSTRRTDQQIASQRDSANRPTPTV